MVSDPHSVDTMDINIHLQHQNIIREKYSSPSGSDLSDVNITDVNHARVLSVNTGDGSCPEDLLDVHTLKESDVSRSNRQSSTNRSRTKYERNNKGQVYSTSASDSEEGIMPETNLSRAKSRSSQSIASQSSTLTIRSLGSGGFRRNRSRASTASTRSSASDRTLTCDSRHGSQETLVDGNVKSDSTIKCGLIDKNVDNLSDSGIHSKHTDTATDNSADNESHDCHHVIQPLVKKKGGKQPQEEYHLLDNLSETALIKKTSTKQSPPSDPTSVARKVLAETGQQRAALEAMQRWSVQSLKEKYEDKPVNVKDIGSRAAEEIVTGKQTSAAYSSSLPGFTSPTAKQGEFDSKIIPSEPNRPAPTLSKASSDVKHISGAQVSFTTESDLNKPKTIMANSLLDGMASYTCSPGERVSNMADVSFSQSELESENELSVIEEESEGVSDLNSSYSNSKLEACLRGLQMINGVQLDRAAPNMTESNVPWYEEGSPTLAEKGVANSHSLSSTPTPKSAKTVTFQDEVEMEILSQCSEMLDTPECSIFETDLDEVQDMDGKECDEMNVDGETTPTGDINDDTHSEQVMPDHSEKAATDHCVTDDNMAEQHSLESAIKHKPPDIPPPPIGYKHPPPYPGPRRQGLLASASSSHNSTDTNSPSNVAPMWMSLKQNEIKGKWNTSPSPVDGPDLNSPQNLARMSKQLYNSFTHGGNPSISSSKITGKNHQNITEQNKQHTWLA